MLPHNFNSCYLIPYYSFDSDEYLKNCVQHKFEHISLLLQHQKAIQNTLGCFKQAKTQSSDQSEQKNIKNSSRSYNSKQALEILKQCEYKTINEKQILSKNYKKIQIYNSFSQETSNNSDSEESPQQEKKNRYSQTKNIIKNYGKSILTFARKNKDLVTKLILKFGITQKQFWTVIQKFQCKINTIVQLRRFWTYNNNQNIGKIFRIISHQYLKKHSLQHIFNSRIKNYPVHIKYRIRLLKALQTPADFNSIKIAEF